MTIEPPGDRFTLPEGAASVHYIAPFCEETDLPQGRLTAVTDVDQAFAIAAATDLLYILSGRQFRQGRSIVRPTAITSSYGTQSFLYPYSSMSGYGAAWGFAAGWAWSAVGQGWWQNGQDLSEVLLMSPVTAINNVVLNGASLGSWYPGGPQNPNYQLYDGRRLVALISPNGQFANAWPWEQSLQLPATMPGTALIDYNWGKSPGPMGKLACIALAIELALAISGTNPSMVSPRVTSIASQGITMQLGNSLEYIKENLTAIPAVDMWLKAVNPFSRRRRAVMLSPNLVRGREQANGYPGG